MEPTIDLTKCRYCLTKLGQRFIQCADCDKLYLCTLCFSWGVEGGCHKKTHPYCIGKKDTVEDLSIFESPVKWNCQEEKKLIEAIEMYGIGNWQDIADKVSTKTPDDCMRHYDQFYINGSLGHTLIDGSRKPCHVIDHTTPSGGNLSPSLYQSHDPVDLGPEEQQLLGFMPNRNDFERDYDNDAESILCKLHPTFDKDELEEALKVAQVSIYTHRLRERKRRKTIARDHNLIPHIMAHILNRRPNHSQFHSFFPASSVGLRRGRGGRGRGRGIARRIHTTEDTAFMHTNHHPEEMRGRGRGRGRRGRGARSFGDGGEGEPKENGTTSPAGSSMESGAMETRGSVCAGSSSKNSQQLVSPVSSQQTRCPPKRVYNAYHIEERLKPFLRYFNGVEAQQFLENLEKEECLRREIEELSELRRKGKTKLSGVKLRSAKSGRIFVTSGKSSDAGPSRENVHKRRRRKKLHFSTYMNKLKQKQKRKEAMAAMFPYDNITSPSH